jgi:hypothetical protein
MKAPSQRHDPVAFGCVAALEAKLRLRYSSNLAQDLRERVHAAAEKSAAGDQSAATTLRRVSWCCYFTCDDVLGSIELPNSAGRILDRRNVDSRQLQAMSSAIFAIEEAVNVDIAEHRMVQDPDTLGLGKFWQESLHRRRSALKSLRNLLAEARVFCEKNTPDAAAEVGHLFVEVLVDQKKTGDEMVQAAEQLVEVTGV